MEKIWLKHYDNGVPHEIDLPEQTIPQLFRETVKKFPDVLAFKFIRGSMTFRELDEESNRFARMLNRLGIKKRGKVALNLPNCPQFIIAYLGILKAGCIAVPCNPLYTERELLHQLNDSEAEIIITLSRFYDKIRKIKNKTGIKVIISTNIKEYLPLPLQFLYTHLKEKKEGDRVTIQKGDYWLQNLITKQKPDLVPDPGIDIYEPACYIYTGGTTGVSKGAVLTHRNLATNTKQIFHWMPDQQEGKEVGIALVPFFHSYGLTTCLNLSLIYCGTLILIPQFDIKRVMKSIHKEKPTLFPGVPTIYVAIINYPDLKKYDLTSLRICISGAAPLPAEVQKEFEELTGCSLKEGYGLTETSPVTHANPVYGTRKTGSIGIPVPNTDAKIVNMDNPEIEMPIGESGQLAIRGPQVMQGYLNKPEENAEIFHGEWLLTGDIAQMDEDGFFYIVDRKKDMIIAGGFNIFPREIEEVLYSNEKVLEATVVGIPDEYRGETVKAYVVPREGQTLTEKEIIDFCANNLAKYKVPKKVEIRTELPKSMVGKVLRRKLLEEELAKNKK